MKLKHVILIVLAMLLVSACMPDLRPLSEVQKKVTGTITGVIQIAASAGLLALGYEVLGSDKEKMMPAKKARVKLEKTDVETETDDEGHFELKAPEGDYNLVAERTGDDGKKYKTRMKVKVNGGQTLDLGSLLIKETGAIFGLVTLVDKNADENLGITVFIPGSDMVSLTDKNGAYMLGGVPEGTWEVAFVKAGYADAGVSNVVVKTGKTVEVTNVTLTQDKEAQALLGTVQGTVQDQQSGNGIPGVLLAVSDTNYVSLSADDGSFRLDLPAGSYTLNILREGYEGSSIEVEVKVGEISEETINLTVKDLVLASVAGTVKDGLGDPVVTAVAQLSPDVGSAQSDSNGTFKIVNVLPGQYTLTISKGGYQSVQFSVGVGNGGSIDIGEVVLKNGSGATQTNTAVWQSIPGGSFSMGDAFGEGDAGELPVHTVTISAFEMMSYEVTNGTYEECVTAGSCTVPGVTASTYGYGSATGDDSYRPVVYVDWNQATAYCSWAGGRLPTEAEWEYAARGGLSGQRFPWGDTIDCSKANYQSNPSYAYDTEGSKRKCVGTTSRVGAYAANDYGLYDMVGNVSEWVNDWYSDTYYSSSPGTDPQGPANGSNHDFRGGHWYGYVYFARIAYRPNNSSTYNSNVNGFRCAR